MCVTTDGHIIGCHDWKYFKSLTNMHDNTDNPLSLADVHNLRINGKYTVLTGHEISDIMKNNKNFILVTDKIKDYALLLKEIPYPDRIIVEVFSVEDYLSALKSGIKYPAYCIWTERELITARTFNFPIVTMGAYFFNKGDIVSIKKLHDAGITILFFHAGFPDGDEATFLQQHLGTTISKVYTDTWSPKHLPVIPAS